jgi:flagellar basal-body rod protein FlgF
MDTSAYVSLSAQLALDKRLSTIAHNIANARTVGFKAGGVAFNEVKSPTASFETAFASTGQAQVEISAGGLKETGNVLDVAIKGDAFLGYMGPSGPYYSRDGRLNMLETGELVNSQGHPLLDNSGSPLSVNPRETAPVIQKSGQIFQAGSVAGQIGLFTLDLSRGFERTEGSGLVPSIAAEPSVLPGESELLQNFIEDSNVNPVTEMVRLIQVTRAFEAASTLSGRVLEVETEAIRALGSR